MRSTRTHRILVTGWRNWPEDLAPFIAGVLGPHIRTPLFWGEKVVVMQGECPYGGADLWAKQAALKLGAEVEGHPAEVRNSRILGPARNAAMVALGAEICLAFPGPGSRGTRDCLLKAIDAGIPTQVWPVEYARQQVKGDVR